ncbi:PREDICTED: transmembrane protein 70, mitochondrial [Dufourea novaeangliae]|uniref:transmembrane protein 70, mitochondrial n=1 Tax=Dufourea novaeangliae TaxID=178035 RepID=UPI000767265A|nr:PREDICTED: transmembrane protein 70, mitochondrial [Dufourea novaeangliae]
MISILQSQIFIKKAVRLQKFLPQRCTVGSFAYNNGDIESFARTLQVRYVHTEGNNKKEKELIYTGLLSKNIFGLKLFTLGTSCVALVTLPFVWDNAIQADKDAITLGLIGFMGVYAICTPLLIHFLVGRKYVANMYYDSAADKYLAQTYSILLKKKTVEFTENDVHVPDFTGPFSTCFVKGKPMFFTEPEFTDKTHYHKLMGHYKPINFQLNTDVDNIKELQRSHKQQ